LETNRTTLPISQDVLWEVFARFMGWFRARLPRPPITDKAPGERPNIERLAATG
jgi:hypothetical protein